MTLTNLLRLISFKHLKHQKTQAFLAAFGICLGVASMVAIDVVNRSVLRSFEDSIVHMTGRASLQISGADSGFPEQMLDRIQTIPGVEYAVPVIETNANLAGGSERSFMILGIDVLQDSNIRDYSVAEENAEIPDPLLFLAKPDSILLTREMAEREGIKIDQKIQVQTVQGNKTFTVRGLLDPKGPAKAAGGDVAVMDIYAVQKAFGKEGKIDRIDVSFLAGKNLDSMKARILAALPDGYYVDTPAGRTRQVEVLLTRYRKSIGLISFMALFVGMYLIYNAVSISVVQRRKEIGILRALGAARGRIISLFLGETLIISALASVAGVGLGILFAKSSVGVVARSVTDFYARASITEIAFSLTDLVKDAGIGVLASVAAAAFPALAAARISPISAIRSVPYAENGFLSAGKVKIASAFFILLSLVILALHPVAGSSSAVGGTMAMFSSMVLLLIGVSLSAPAFLRRFIASFHRFLSPRLGPGGRLAGLNLQKNVSRNAVAVAAVFFSIALFVSSGSMIFSLQKSTLDYIEAVENCDILVSSGHPLSMGGTSSIAMPGDMLEELEKVPGVLSVDPFRRTQLVFGGRRITLGAIDIIRSMEYNPYMITQGKRDDIRRLLPGKDYVMVNETVAARHHIKPGDTIVLPSPDGPKRFGVVAIVVSYISDSGSVWMDIDTYRRHWQDNLADNFAVRVKQDHDIAKVRDAILDRFGRERKLFALPAREMKDEVRKMLDRTFVMNNAVTVITMVIAGLGIIITLLASVLERTREIGILRSMGMTRRQVSSVVITESVLLGTTGGLLGLAAGIVIGWISLEGFFRLDLGASISYHIHYASIVWALLLSAGLSAIAGLYPARHAAKINVVEALSYE